MINLQLKVTNPQKQISQAELTNSRYTDAQKAKIADAAKEFESLLTSIMLKSMSKSNEGIFGGGSFGGEYFKSIFENKIAVMMSQRNNMGIAGDIYKKITGEKLSGKFQKSVIKPPVSSEKINNAIKKSSSISPSVKAANRLSHYENFINAASNTYGVNKNLIKSVILAESSAKSNAMSAAKAKGLMQLMDSTATDMGVNNIWDPKENIFGGTKYLAEMLRKYNGDLKLALASYNAGPQNVDKYGGVPPFNETKNYIQRVVGYLNHLNGEGNGNNRSL